MDWQLYQGVHHLYPTIVGIVSNNPNIWDCKMVLMSHGKNGEAYKKAFNSILFI